jgi:membrane-associated phospholipid phosphatase
MEASRTIGDRAGSAPGSLTAPAAARPARRRLTRALVFLGVGVAAAAAASFTWLDRTAATWGLALAQPIRSAASWVGTGGDAWPWLVVLGLLLGWCLWRRWHAAARWVGLLLAAVAAAGLTVDLLKVLLGRYRPMALIDKDQWGFHFLGFNSLSQSFPSGHAATIGALGAVCWLTWPRWWPAWLAGMLAVCAARVLERAHYPSDVLVGAYVGALIAVALTRLWTKRGWLPRP